MPWKWRAALPVAICAIVFPAVALAAVSKPIIFASGATPSNRVGDGDLVIAGCDAPFSARR